MSITATTTCGLLLGRYSYIALPIIGCGATVVYMIDSARQQRIKDQEKRKEIYQHEEDSRLAAEYFDFLVKYSKTPNAEPLKYPYDSLSSYQSKYRSSGSMKGSSFTSIAKIASVATIKDFYRYKIAHTSMYFKWGEKAAPKTIGEKTYKNYNDWSQQNTDETYDRANNYIMFGTGVIAVLTVAYKR